MDIEAVLALIMFLYSVIVIIIANRKIKSEREKILLEVMKYLDAETDSCDFDRGIRYASERLMYFINRLDG